VIKQSKTELVAVMAGFDYALLDSKIAQQVRSAANRIRERVKRTMEDLIAVGQALLTVKEALPHGQFGPWMLAEFGWSDRTARNFMEVAEVFGPKSEIISDLAIAPTAAYLLAAPSASFEARQAALDRAASGETITVAVAKEILGAARHKASRKGKTVTAGKLCLRLTKVLDRFRERWDAKELSELARQLREFADGLDKGKPGGKKAGKT